MRKFFDQFLTDLADNDGKVRLIIADVGDFPLFSRKHREKFLNVGVSESNAVGIAAGLAFEGYRVFVYGISSFFLYRAYEQLKYSVSYWKQPVTFVGVGFGWKYFFIGAGHFCPDDIGLARGLPGFRIHTPYCLDGLIKVLSNSGKEPEYLRLTANIVDAEIPFSTPNSDIVLLTYGEMVKTCQSVVWELRVDHAVNLDFIALEDLNDETISAVVKMLSDKRVIVIEDQYVNDGLTSILWENGCRVMLHIGLPIHSVLVAESRSDLVKAYGMDKDSIIRCVLERLA